MGDPPLAKIKSVQTLVVECNYDDELLDQDPRRPWALKQRIKGRHGHLSNRETLEFLKTVESPAWRNVFLAHLSKDCNEVARVAETFSAFSLKDCAVSVVDPRDGSLISLPQRNQTGTYG